MTQAEFTAFYPQFAGFTPVVVMTEYIRQANKRFSAFSAEDAEEARRLYTAHKLTMYARVALPDGVTPTKAQIAAAGQAQQSQGIRRGERHPGGGRIAHHGHAPFVRRSRAGSGQEGHLSGGA